VWAATQAMPPRRHALATILDSGLNMPLMIMMSSRSRLVTRWAVNLSWLRIAAGWNTRRPMAGTSLADGRP
jgi:hypothetical protein